jgi:glycosyltransferase involved in cell wall biosynthesis
LEDRLADIASSRERRQVAVFIPRLVIGGTEQHLLDVLPRIDPRRFAVTVVTIRGPGPLDDEMRRRGVTVVHATTRQLRPLSLVAAFFGIARILRRERPDIVHFFLPEAYFIGGLCAVLLGTRWRVMSRRSLNLYHQRRRFSATIERWLHRRMDAVLANSNAVAEDLTGEGVSNEKLHTVYSGVDAEPYAVIDRFAVRSDLAIAEDAIVFVCVANLIPYKGHHDLLEALARAAGRLPETWYLLVVGRDEGIGAQLRGHAQELGLEQNTRWMGERTDTPSILIASDIAVLASHEEGLPKSILESMAASLPSVVTGVGGTPEAVIDGVTGKVVEPRNVAALADALVELANDSQKRDRFGSAAKARMEQMFRVETCVARYEEIYDSLLSQFATVSEFGAQEGIGTTEPKKSL